MVLFERGALDQSLLSVSKVDCSELPEWAAVGRLPANRGRGRGLIAIELQRTAVDFSKLQVLAAHFGQDCRGLWQGKPLYFKGNRCSRLWKLTMLLGISACSCRLHRLDSRAQPRRLRTARPSRRRVGLDRQ
jgi:hypothetical protein